MCFLKQKKWHFSRQSSKFRSTVTVAILSYLFISLLQLNFFVLLLTGACEVCLLFFPKYWINMFFTYLMLNYFVHTFLTCTWISTQSLEQSFQRLISNNLILITFYLSPLKIHSVYWLQCQKVTWHYLVNYFNLHHHMWWSSDIYEAHKLET